MVQLIGTDIQARFGFVFLQPGADGAASDVLLKKTWRIECWDSPAEITVGGQNSDENSPGVVCLIRATKLPPQHAKLVMAEID